MRNVLTAAVFVLAGLLQVTYPATMAPAQVVPDVVLLVVLAAALYYRPSHAVLWWAGLAGLIADVWQPTRFGSWTLACIVVATVAVVVHTRLLPRLTNPGAWLTALIALASGIIVLGLANALGASLAAGGASFVRQYLPKLVLDVALAVPLLEVVRRTAVALRLQPAGPGSTGASSGGTKLVIRV